MKVIIDDLRILNVDGDVLYLRTLQEAIDWMKNIDSPPEEIWFDFDLGGDDTSYPIAYALEEDAFLARYENSVEPFFAGTRMIIHTDNPVGKQRLRRALTKHYDVDLVDAKGYTVGTVQN